MGDKKRVGMGVLTFSMLNVAAVLSIVNFPEQAVYGYAIIFFITACSLCFFIPTALVSAELASAWPEDGGMYLWVREAFGPKWGLTAVTMQWLNSLPWYATVLTFISTTTAYIFDPALATNRYFVYGMLFATIWICTFLNFRGIRLYEMITSIGVTVGTLVPTAAIIVMAVLYLASGQTPAISFSAAGMFPALGNVNEWMLLAGMMVSLAGIDMTAVHITDVNNPRKNYPKAILISSALIIVLSISGSLSIALIVSPAKLSLASGAAEAFDRMFEVLKISWMTPFMCVLLIVGALATIVTWLLGPSKGLLQAAKEGYVGKFWAHTNSRGIPTHILTVQAAVVSLIGVVIFAMPSISGAFWVMMALSAQLYMVMYVFMFSAAIHLRYSQPDKPRPYRLPCGNIGMIVVAGLGLVTSVFAMAMGFIPPQGIRAEGTLKMTEYVIFIGLGSSVMLSIPILAGALAMRRHNRKKESLFLPERGQ